MSDARRVHEDAFIVDLHTHGPGFVPRPFSAVWRAVTIRGPAETGFDVLRRADVDAVVAKAVGDPVVTRWYMGRSAWDAVDEQLARIEQQAAASGAVMARSVDDLVAARASRVPAVVLGVEGADALGEDVARVDAWHRRGVRVVVLVHLRDNQLGTTCLPWQQYAGPMPVGRRSTPGLTPLGAAVVRRMNALGVAVDVAHADSATLRGVLEVAAAPVLSSHTGARALQDFARYLHDDELRAIASTGGVVGLWPYRSRRWGVASTADLMRHAHHIVDVVGVEHLAIGTDMNGVPRVMDGYGGEADLSLVTTALLDAGFTEPEVRAVLGGNAMRVLGEVADAADARV